MFKNPDHYSQVIPSLQIAQRWNLFKCLTFKNKINNPFPPIIIVKVWFVLQVQPTTMRKIKFPPHTQHMHIYVSIADIRNYLIKK